MQGAGASTSMELTVAPVAAPLEAAWDSIRTGLRRDLGADLRRLAEAGRARRVRSGRGGADIVMPSQFMADWVRSHFGERLTLAWKTCCRGPRSARDGSSRCATPTPLLILEEVAGAGGTRSRRAQFRSALPFRNVHRRQGQRSCRHRRRTLALGRKAAASTRSSSMAARAAARPTFSMRSAMPSRQEPRQARRVDVGREVHGRIHSRAEGK